MGFRFRKSIKIAPGVRLNIGKKSAGISVGGKAGGLSFNTRSGVRSRVSIPGTGISYSTKVGGKKRRASTRKSGARRSTTQNSAVRPKNTKPVVFRWWYYCLIAFFLIGGICNITEDIGAAIFGLAVSAVLTYLSISKYRQLKDDQELDDLAASLEEADEAPEVETETPQ